MESSSLLIQILLDPLLDGGSVEIPDDSYWRDNITPTKYDDPSSPRLDTDTRSRSLVYMIQTPSIETDQLPWANVMYPVTAGGGQQSSFQTPNIRQGMFVFGFFLDGSDMQVPIIMGVLGNNSKTELAGASSHPILFWH